MKRKFVLGVVLIAALSIMAATAFAATPIRLVTYGSEATFERWDRIAAEFHKDRPDYELDVEIATYAEYPTKISLMIASGAPPDVFLTWAQYKAQWVEQGMIMDLAQFWERSEIAKSQTFFPFMIDAASYKGEIVGVPYDFSSMAVVANVDAMNEAGLAVPDENWTTEEYRDYAVRLSRPEQGLYGTHLSAANTMANWGWAVNFTGQGWLNEDHTELYIQDEGYLELLDYWTELVDLGAAPAPGTAPARDQWSGGYNMWQGWVHWGERAGTMASYDWTMLPFPKGAADNKTSAHGHMWTLPSNATNPENGWVFLEWLLSPEGQHAIVTVDARQPLSNNPELWDLFFSTVQADKQETMRDLVMDTLYGQNRIYTMQYWEDWPDVDRVMKTYLPRVFRGQEPATNAMAQAAREIEAILKK